MLTIILDIFVKCTRKWCTLLRFWALFSRLLLPFGMFFERIEKTFNEDAFQVLLETFDLTTLAYQESLNALFHNCANEILRYNCILIVEISGIEKVWILLRFSLGQKFVVLGLGIDKSEHLFTGTNRGVYRYNALYKGKCYKPSRFSGNFKNQINTILKNICSFHYTHFFRKFQNGDFASFFRSAKVFPEPFPGLVR